MMYTQFPCDGSPATFERTGGPSLFRARRTFSTVGLACFFILMISTLIQLAASLLLQRLAPQVLSSPWYVWAQIVIPIYCIAFPLGLLVFRLVPKASPPPRQKMRPGQLLICFIICLFLMYAGNIVGLFVTWLLPGSAASSGLDSLVMGSSVWIRAAVMVLLAPIIEECIFRKLLIDRIRRYGEGISILLSGAMFGLFHGNFSQCFYAFALGCMFAYIYLRTGRMRYPIFLHMAINFMGGVIAPFLLELTMDLPADLSLYFVQQEAMSPEEISGFLLMGLYSTFVFSTAIAGLVLLIVHRKKFFLLPAPERLPKGKGFSISVLNVGMLLFLLSTVLLFVFSLL